MIIKMLPPLNEAKQQMQRRDERRRQQGRSTSVVFARRVSSNETLFHEAMLRAVLVLPVLVQHVVARFFSFFVFHFPSPVLSPPCQSCWSSDAREREQKARREPIIIALLFPLASPRLLVLLLRIQSLVLRLFLTALLVAGSVLLVLFSTTLAGGFVRCLEGPEKAREVEEGREGKFDVGSITLLVRRDKGDRLVDVLCESPDDLDETSGSRTKGETSGGEQEVSSLFGEVAVLAL